MADAVSLPAGFVFEHEVLGSFCRTHSRRRRLFGYRAKHSRAYNFYDDELAWIVSADERLLGCHDRWPVAKRARRMWWLVARRFSLAERINLRMCNAVGTSFDRDHGVDTLFYYRGAKVTIDLSLRPKTTLKADILLRRETMNDRQVFERTMDDVARRLRGKPLKRQS